MPKLTREQRIQKAERELKALTTKHKRLGTLIAKKRRSLGALRRALDKLGPTPAPAPPEPAVLLAKLDQDQKAAAERAEKNALMQKFRKLAKQYARKGGIDRPVYVRWAGTKGACSSSRMRHTAHVHCHTWKGVEICVSYEAARRACAPGGWYSAEDLMAHEVAHVGIKTPGERGILHHGPVFNRRMEYLLGRRPMERREHEGLDDETLDQVEA